MNEEEIEEKFNNLLNELTKEEWNKWVMSWLDEEYVDDIIYKNWNIDIKKDYIPDLEEIIKRREQKKKEDYYSFASVYEKISHEDKLTDEQEDYFSFNK